MESRGPGPPQTDAISNNAGTEETPQLFECAAHAQRASNLPSTVLRMAFATVIVTTLFRDLRTGLRGPELLAKDSNPGPSGSGPEPGTSPETELLTADRGSPEHAGPQDRGASSRPGPTLARANQTGQLPPRPGQQDEQVWRVRPTPSDPKNPGPGADLQEGSPDRARAGRG